MAALTIPAAGWSLMAPDKSSPNTAVTLHIVPSILEELKRASKTPQGLQFIAGKSPIIRYGKRTLDLILTPDRYVSVLYESNDDTTLTYLANATYRAKTSTHGKGAGAEDALLELQRSMAEIDDQKKASQTQVADALIPAPKNRFEAAKQARNGALLSLDRPKAGSSPASTALRSPALAPTSAFHDLTSPKTRALKHAITHLLAIRSLSMEEIASKVRISMSELKPVLQTLAQNVDGKMKLTDKAYKELDVWRFKYLVEDRKAAIDNAIRAYDRLRLGKDDKLWQMLLSKDERGKGRILSKFHGGPGAAPRVASPLPDGHISSAVNTPRPVSTPTLGATKKGVIDRLLSKDPKKARAVEEAKDKKRKERQAATESEERPAKRQATTTAKKSNANVKSQEFVFSSEDEDHDTSASSGKPSHSTEKSRAVNGIHKTPGKTVPASEKPRTVNSDRGSREKPTLHNREKSSTAHHKPQAKTATTGRLSPHDPTQSQRAQISPPKAVRPTVPSPLGAAARKRVASDVSDRSGISQKRSVEGLGISTQRRRHDTVTGIETPKLHKSENSLSLAMVQTRGGKDTSNPVVASKKKKKVPVASDRPTSTENGHRKAESTSSASHSRTQSTNEHSQASPLDIGSDSSVSVIDTITYAQGADLAERFKADYYPQYSAMYDDISSRQLQGQHVAKEEVDELLKLHTRLVQMKAEINAAWARGPAGSES